MISELYTFLFLYNIGSYIVLNNVTSFYLQILVFLIVFFTIKKRKKKDGGPRKEEEGKWGTQAVARGSKHHSLCPLSFFSRHLAASAWPHFPGIIILPAQKKKLSPTKPSLISCHVFTLATCPFVFCDGLTNQLCFSRFTSPPLLQYLMGFIDNFVIANYYLFCLLLTIWSDVKHGQNLNNKRLKKT